LELSLPFSITGLFILRLEALALKVQYAFIWLCSCLYNILRVESKGGSNLNIMLDDRPLYNEEDDKLGFVSKNGAKGIVDDFYEICINEKFVAEKNTIIILDSLYRIGKSSFLNLLHNKIKKINNTLHGIKTGKIKEIKFSATTLLADCDTGNEVNVLYKFLDTIKQELRGTANYELFKYIIKGYFKNKLSIDFTSLGNNNFQELLKLVRGKRQKIILIIEDLDRVRNSDLKHVIKFLWHIKDLPYIVTILPAQAQILCFNIDLDSTDYQPQKQSAKAYHLNNKTVLPSYSQNYHKLIDDVYYLTDKVRHMQVKWLWSTENELYNKDDDEILIEVHNNDEVKNMSGYANPDIVNQGRLYIDNGYIVFNGQRIRISDLSQEDQHQVIKIKNSKDINFSELLFLPLKMLNFWQNTTIYPHRRHELLFKTILLNILNRFQVNTTEIKKIIKLFKSNYKDFKDKNISDVIVYCLIEVRYKFYLMDIIITPNYEVSTLNLIKNSVLNVYSPMDIDYKSLPKQINNLLEYTSSHHKIFPSINNTKNYYGLFDFYYHDAGILWSNNSNGELNIPYELQSNGARNFMKAIFYNIHMSCPTKCQYLLFMFYHYWLVLNNKYSISEKDNVNTLYKLTALKFFEENPNYEHEMTDIEIESCFSNSSGIIFAILYIANYHELRMLRVEYLKNYEIWMAKNIRKVLTLIQDIKSPLHQSYIDLLFYTFIIKTCEIKGDYYKEWCLFTELLYRDENGAWKYHHSLLGNHTIYMQLNTINCSENLEITMEQFVQNINKIHELATSKELII
jgi:hypothetical protein